MIPEIVLMMPPSLSLLFRGKRPNKNKKVVKMASLDTEMRK